jgi:hypothetical protein
MNRRTVLDRTWNNFANFGNKSLNPGDFNCGIATEGTFLIRELEIIKIKAGLNLIMSLLNYNVELRSGHNAVIGIHFY